MDSMIENIIMHLLHILSSDRLIAFLSRYTNLADKWITGIPWINLIKVGSCIILGIGLVLLVLYFNDLVFAHYRNRRLKVHHLTIRNNGNTNSIYLLRAVSLPRELTIDFNIAGNPMITTTQVKKEPVTEEKQKSAEKLPEPVQGAKNQKAAALIPDLSDPWQTGTGAVTDAAEKAKKAATETAKTSGLMASILGTLSAVLPFKNKALKEGQEALKGFQQDTTGVVTAVNNKVNSVNTLKKQTGNLVSKVPGVELPSEQSVKDAVHAVAEQAASEDQEVQSAELMGDFIYDENVWRKNKNRKDEDGHELNFAQSRILEPGEAMKIDLEIRNHSGNLSAVSHLYKIEVWQIPQTKLHLVGPRQLISGVVGYSEISPIAQYLPGAMVIGATILAALVMAGYCQLLF